MSTAFALGQLRHLYAQMVAGQVKNTQEAARGLLGPAIAELERAEATRTTPTHSPTTPCEPCGGGCCKVFGSQAAPPTTPAPTDPWACHACGRNAPSIVYMKGRPTCAECARPSEET